MHNLRAGAAGARCFDAPRTSWPRVSWAQFAAAVRAFDRRATIFWSSVATGLAGALQLLGGLPYAVFLRAAGLARVAGRCRPRAARRRGARACSIAILERRVVARARSLGCCAWPWPAASRRGVRAQWCAGACIYLPARLARGMRRRPSPARGCRSRAALARCGRAIALAVIAMPLSDRPDFDRQPVDRARDENAAECRAPAYNARRARGRVLPAAEAARARNLGPACRRAARASPTCILVSVAGYADQDVFMREVEVGRRSLRRAIRHARPLDPAHQQSRKTVLDTPIASAHGAGGMR